MNSHDDDSPDYGDDDDGRRFFAIVVSLCILGAFCVIAWALLA